MDLQHLNTFRTIAILGSFSQTADVLGYAQSTVSEHIRLLEAELQARLFKRAGNKRVVLTPEGERLLSYAQKMSNLENQIKVEVNHPEEPHGNLSIRIPETVSQYYLSALFGKYNAKFPAINLGLMDCVFFDLPEELQAGVVDLGFLIIDRYVAKNITTEITRTRGSPASRWTASSSRSPTAIPCGTEAASSCRWSSRNAISRATTSATTSDLAWDSCS